MSYLSNLSSTPSKDFLGYHMRAERIAIDHVRDIQAPYAKVRAFGKAYALALQEILEKEGILNANLKT